MELLRGRPFCVIDFEASCLPKLGSFPIEVAVAHPDGRVRSWLVRPELAWLERGVWDPESEKVHGLSLERLTSEGRPAKEVAAELTAEIEGCIVLSDHAPSDQEWFDELCRACGMSAWFIEDMSHLVTYPCLLANDTGDPAADWERVEQARKEARERIPEVHRAAPDARRNIAFIQILTGSTNPAGQTEGDVDA